MIEIFALAIAIAITIVTSLILLVNWIIEKRRIIKFKKSLRKKGWVL